MANQFQYKTLTQAVDFILPFTEIHATEPTVHAGYLWATAQLGTQGRNRWYSRTFYISLAFATPWLADTFLETLKGLMDDTPADLVVTTDNVGGGTTTKTYGGCRFVSFDRQGDPRSYPRSCRVEGTLTFHNTAEAT
jgi:hypothetical protein